MRELIEKVQRKENLLSHEVDIMMAEIMSGRATESDMADMLTALNAKGPTVDEIAAAARMMRKFLVPVTTRHPAVLDTCGTGGDKRNTFNISTVTAFVVAGAGVPVAKHGNRSVSSRCGSACLLEGLGVNLHTDPEHVGGCLDRFGIAFLFAQKLHPAMKHVAAVRKVLRVETIFNILGPLTNPARATHQMMGVYHRDLVTPLAHVLQQLGLRRALVVHGNDGLDEITTTDVTFVSEFTGQEVLSYDVSPEEVGIARAKPEDLVGGDMTENIRIAREILDGAKGPKRDVVVLNAAYALYTAERVSGIPEGVSLATDSLDSGKAKEKLEQLVAFTNR